MGERESPIVRVGSIHTGDGGLCHHCRDAVRKTLMPLVHARPTIVLILQGEKQKFLAWSPGQVGRSQDPSHHFVL